MLLEMTETELPQGQKLVEDGTKEVVKKELKNKKDNPEKRAHMDHLLAAATFMQTLGKPSLQHYYLKNLLGTAEKNVLPLGSEVKQKFCKQCTQFYETEDTKPQNVDGLFCILGSCPGCGKLKKYFTTPKRVCPKQLKKKKTLKVKKAKAEPSGAKAAKVTAAQPDQNN